MAALRSRGPAQQLIRTAVLAAACALAAAGCGGDEDGPTAAASTTTSTTTQASSGPASDLREQFNDLITELLTSAEGLSPAVARCAVEVLGRSVPDEDLRAALDEQAETGEVPADIVDAAFDAGAECADR